MIVAKNAIRILANPEQGDMNTESALCKAFIKAPRHDVVSFSTLFQPIQLYLLATMPVLSKSRPQIAFDYHLRA